MRNYSIIYFRSIIARRTHPTIGGERKFTLETNLQPLKECKILLYESLNIIFVLIQFINFTELNHAIHEIVRILTTIEK